MTPNAPAGTATQSTPGFNVPAPILVMLFLVIMVPVEFSVQVGTLTMNSSRTCLLVMTFLVVPRLGTIQWRIYDTCFTLHVALSSLAFMLAYGGSAGIERAGSYILEFLIIYLAARVYLRELWHFRGVVLFLFALACISAAFAIPEAYLKTRFIHDFATSVTGNRYPFANDTRMGILRAASFFEHPILYGIFCSSLFSLVWFISTPGQRVWRSAVIVGGTYLSASSAPMLILLLQFLLSILERLSRNVKRRVTVFGAIGVFMVVMLESFTGRGVVGTLALLTLNPATAYIRRSQWNFGIDDVMRNPLIGFVAENWTRPHWLAPSVDNWWLLLMMRSGIPSVLILFLAIATIWIALARRPGNDPLFVPLRTGWGLTILALVLGGATVTYFGKLQPLFAFYVGFGAALANCALTSPASAETAPRPTEARVPRYTRFPSPAVARNEPGAQVLTRGDSGAQSLTRGDPGARDTARRLTRGSG